MYVKIYSLVDKSRQSNEEAKKLFFNNTTEAAVVDSSMYHCIFRGPIPYERVDEIPLFFEENWHPLLMEDWVAPADVIVTSTGAFGHIEYVRGSEAGGIVPVIFDESKVQANTDTCRAVLIIPGLPAFEAEIKDDDTVHSALIRGYMDDVRIEGDVYLFYNRPYLDDDNPKPNYPSLCTPGVINGIGIIARYNYSNFSSLTQEEVEKYTKMYSRPIFFKDHVFATYDDRMHGYCTYAIPTDKMPRNFPVYHLETSYEELEEQYELQHNPDRSRTTGPCVGCPYADTDCFACFDRD